MLGPGEWQTFELDAGGYGLTLTLTRTLALTRTLTLTLTITLTLPSPGTSCCCSLTLSLTLTLTLTLTLFLPYISPISPPYLTRYELLQLELERREYDNATYAYVSQDGLGGDMWLSRDSCVAAEVYPAWLGLG